ncbi:MAG: GAF domain-containing protein, partial [Anaerolineales bacterium]|nr:GAF domain-containing protein [Anaerolineales bacterium]
MTTQINRPVQFFKSLSFKIGVIIILVEVVVLTLAGAIYLDRFSNAIDRRIEEQVMLPASLINSGVLSLVSLADQEIMHQLVGEELLEGWAVDEEGDIFASYTEPFRGQNINNLPAIKSSDFDFAQPQTQVIRNANDITSITPIYRNNETIPRLFVYIKVGTTAAQQEKREIRMLFLSGFALTIVLTSLIIVVSFRLTLLGRLNGVLKILEKVRQDKLNIQVEPDRSPDEIGVLHRNVITMTETLHRRSLARTKAQAELQQEIEVRKQAEAAERRERAFANALLETTQLINKSLDVEEVLARILQAVDDIVPHDGANIMLLDHDQQTVYVVKYCDCHTEQRLAPPVLNRHYPFAELSGLQQMSSTGRPVLITDTQQQDTWQPTSPQRRPIRSYVGAPIVTAEKPIGFLNIDSLEPHAFTEKHAQQLAAFANQAAIALNNARLYNELEQYNQTLEEAVKQRTAELTEANVELRKLSRAKDEFVSNVSHELRTPLTSLIGYAELLRDGDGGPLNPVQDGMVGVIERNGRRLRDLIEDLLTLSRINTGTLHHAAEQVDLVATLVEARRVLEPALGAGDVDVHWSIPDALPTIQGDRAQLERVVLNLVTNAVKFTLPGGQVKVTVTDGDHELLLRVADTGIGIPA